MLPKLFWRLAECLEPGDGDLSLTNLGRFPKAKADRVTVLGWGGETRFGLIEIGGQTLMLTEAPEKPDFCGRVDLRARARLAACSGSPGPSGARAAAA